MVFRSASEICFSFAIPRNCTAVLLAVESHKMLQLLFFSSLLAYFSYFICCRIVFLPFPFRRAKTFQREWKFPIFFFNNCSMTTLALFNQMSNCREMCCRHSSVFFSGFSDDKRKKHIYSNTKTCISFNELGPMDFCATSTTTFRERRNKIREEKNCTMSKSSEKDEKHQQSAYFSFASTSWHFIS